MTEEYKKRKESAWHEAKCLEQFLEIHTANKKELKEIHDHLEKLATRAGLIKEFKKAGYL